MREAFSWSFTIITVAGMICYIAQDWLRVYKRRNDLLDKFQAFERNMETRLLQNSSELADHASRIVTLAAAHSNLCAALERQVTRIAEVETYTRKEITNLGGTVLDEVRAIKTTQAAAFTQSPRITGRSFKP